MLRLWRRCVFLLFFLAGTCLFSGVLYAAPEILAADQLQPGMYGIAKTVVKGTLIEEFDVEIVGVLENGPGNQMILARASGSVIERTGGVLHGMSGSPVYVDGKLIGALAGGWSDLNMRFFYIQPIAEMLKIWDMPDVKNQKKIPQVDLKRKDEQVMESPVQEAADALPKGEGAKYALEEKNRAREAVDPEKDPAAPLSAPLVAEGFTDAAFHMLKERLEPYGITPYAGLGASLSHQTPQALEPGSALGVALVLGDFTLGATGTVTAVEDNKVLAFGHPFYRRGNVNYFLTDAEVLTSEYGNTTGRKIAQLGNVVGLINQDRSTGIGGVVGRYPSVVPLQVEVRDKQLAKEQRYHAQMAYDEELVAPLAATMVYNAIDRTMDRTGASTMKIEFEILANGVPDGVIKRDNMYYHTQDTGQMAVGELLQALTLLASNTSEEIDVFGIKAVVEVDETRRTASIIEVKPAKTTVQPGETVMLSVKLKPYRGEEVTVDVPFTVPLAQQSGTIMLEVRGGGLVPLAQLMMQQQGIDLSAEEDKMKPFADKVKEFLDTNKNNEIIVSPVVIPDEKTSENQGKTAEIKKTLKTPVKEQSKKKKVPEIKNKKATDYIIDNVHRVAIEVE